MKKQSRCSRGAALFLICLLALVPLQAQAANIAWVTVPGTGDWTNGVNWAGGSPPGGTDSAFLTNMTGSYTVNFDTASPITISNLTMRASAGNTATLNINSGMLTITGATAFTFNSNLVVNVNSGGVVVNAGSGQAFNGGTLNINGGIWTNNPTFSLGANVGPFAQLNVSNGLLYTAADLRLDAPASGVSRFVVDGGFANIAGGSFYLGTTAGSKPPTNNQFIVTGGVVRLPNYQSRAGSAEIKGGAVTNAGTFIMGDNNGTSPTNLFVQTGGTWEQQGTVRIGNYTNSWNVLTLGGGTFANRSLLSVGEGSYAFGLVKITNGAWWQEGIAYVAANVATRTNSWGNFSISGGSFTTTNNFLVANGFNATATGTVTVAGGTLAVSNAAGTATMNLGLLGQGTLNMSNGTLIVDRLLATNGTSSVVNFAGGTLHTRALTVSNTALFTVGNGVSTANLVLNGGLHRFANGLQIANNATLAGTGSVVTATLTNFGTIAPGFSPGTLTVTGDVFLASTSILDMEIAGTGPGQFDVFNVVGNVQLDGELKVTLDSYSPVAGDSFDLINGTLAGGFASYNLPTLGGGLVWDTSQVGVTGVLSVVLIPEPSAATLLGLTLLAGLAWRRRAQ